LWARGLAGGGVLACVAAIALVAWMHSGGGPARGGQASAGHSRAAAAAAERGRARSAGAGLAERAWRDWLSFPPYRDVVPVLMYHSIGGRPSYLTTPRALFAAQMRALKLGGFHPLTLRQYAAYVHGARRDLPERPIMLTFDDGRQDAYQAADGILRRYGFHATELAVPGWILAHPEFSVSWAELAQMYHGTTWDVASHFGYGPEKVVVSKTGATGARFGYLAYLPAVPSRTGHPGQPAHLESFAQFKKEFTGNELWGIQQFRDHLPGFQPLATAIPGSDYGQHGTNDPRIARYVLTWLDRHFSVVFGGDYLDQGWKHSLEIPGRFSPRLSYRMSLGPADTLPALYCRLFDFVTNVPITAEHRCLVPPRSGGLSAASGTGGTPSSRRGGPGPEAAQQHSRPARAAGRS
jgi:peptidoglycan/xylan/chitin deacetylase (PgdA/CDA1 family)